jgi:Xaa-Pro aminopeptidase
VPAERLRRARSLLPAAAVDALVITRQENVRYLSGFTGTAGSLLISSRRAVLITDPRYAGQAAAQARGFTAEISPRAPWEIAVSLAGGGRIGFEADSVPYAAWEAMGVEAHDNGRGVLVPCRGLIEGLRAIKDPAELDVLESAATLAAASLAEVLPMVKPGAVERDVALAIEHLMQRKGAEGAAFASIVASGPRAALPHGRASERRIEAGDMVVIDIGARFEGYHSDMTRTVCAGRPADEAATIHEVVREAQRRAIEAVRPGATARDVDAAARDTIAEAGFGSFFSHGTGHGVGLQVHEAPRIGPRSDDVLEAGMVLTIEPGIYVPGRTGVRIEDMVAVTGTGSRRLTPSAADDWILE